MSRSGVEQCSIVSKIGFKNWEGISQASCNYGNGLKPGLDVLAESLPEANNGKGLDEGVAP